MKAPRSEPALSSVPQPPAVSGLAKGYIFRERYRLDQRIGRGGMGEVWEATELSLERRVAIKFVHPRLARDHASRERFVREMKSLARVEHPNIVRLYAAGLEPQPHMIMERVHGVPLRELILAGGRLDPTVAACYAVQIAEGLGAAHRARLSHRDIKPENIIVSDDSRAHVWIVDFGIARQTDTPRRDGTTDRLGTLGYIPPEVARCEPADHRGDLYQLGVVLYEMITGRKPYSDIDESSETDMQAAHAYLAPDPIHAIVPECSDALWSVVARLLAKAPEQRYQSADAVLVDLRDALRPTAPPSANPVVAGTIQRELVRRRLSERPAPSSRRPVNDVVPLVELPRGGTEPLRPPMSPPPAPIAEVVPRTTIPFALLPGAAPPRPTSQFARDVVKVTEPLRPDPVRKVEVTKPLRADPKRTLGAPFRVPRPQRDVTRWWAAVAIPTSIAACAFVIAVLSGQSRRHEAQPRSSTTATAVPSASSKAPVVPNVAPAPEASSSAPAAPSAAPTAPRVSSTSSVKTMETARPTVVRPRAAHFPAKPSDPPENRNPNRLF